MVGARQLADVRWSVSFDDVELTAAEIRDLARQAKPLLKSRGRWVELDRADLNEAAAALADRAAMTRMTGADMLRHALGLEGSAAVGRHHDRGPGMGGGADPQCRPDPVGAAHQAGGVQGAAAHLSG